MAISCPWSASCRARSSALRSRWSSRRAEICTCSSTARRGSRATTTLASSASSTTPAIAKPIVAPRSTSRRARCPCASKLSSAGTLDLDEDSLRYAWTITRRDGTVLRRLTDPNPSFTFAARRRVHGVARRDRRRRARVDSAQVQIVAGNEPPKVDVDLVGEQQDVLLPRRSGALRGARDRSRGRLARRTAASRRERVTVTAEYLKDGVPPARERVWRRLATQSTGRADRGERLPLVSPDRQEVDRARIHRRGAAVHERQHRHDAPRAEDPRRRVWRVGQRDDAGASAAQRGEARRWSRTS